MNEKYIFIKRKLSQLYKPFVIYGVVFLLLTSFFYRFNIIDYQYDMEMRWNKIIGILLFKDIELLLTPFWFLRSLFTVSVIFLFIKWIFAENNIGIIITCFVVLVIGCVMGLKKIYLPCQLQRECIVLFFYAAGYYIKVWNIKIDDNKRILFLLEVMTLITLSFFVKVDLIGTCFNTALGLLISSLLGIYILLKVSCFFANVKSNVKNFFLISGKESLAILGLHFLSFKLVSLFFIQYYHLDVKCLVECPVISTLPSSTFHWLFYTVVGIFIPLWFNKVLKSIYCRIC